MKIIGCNKYIIKLHKTYEKQQVLIFEYLESNLTDLFFKIKNKISILKKILINVLLALKCIHDNNIVHGDLKTSNIMVKSIIKPTEIVLIDFGNSFVENTKTLLLSTYPPPEFEDDEEENIYDRSIDIYAFGVIVKQLLEYDTDPNKEKFLQKILNKDPKKRFKTIDEIMKDPLFH